jgi:dipeptidyl aminopeptidase/acylaminoacyl peptidase
MTKKNLVNLALVVVYIAVMFIIGCFPEDSLQWSSDGSTGIYRKKGALFIVDGNSGSLTQVAPKETTTRWPAISPDGSMIAFGRIVKVDRFNKALKLLPPAQVKLIEAHAEILKQKILAEGIKDGNFPFIGKPVATDGGQKDSFNDQHIAWVQRYLIENADTQLARRIGTELANKTKSKDLTYCQLVCAPTADPNNRKILVTSSQQLWRIRFSPDCRLIAYGADRINGAAWDVGYDLYIVSPAENTPAVFLAPATAAGYDFRADSRAIAYIKPEDEFFNTQKPTLGTLVEQTIIDPNGKFLASTENPDGNDFPAAYSCTGAAVELAGVLYHPWMHVSYAGENRIFFASAKMSLPSGKLDEEKTTIFCCDTLTGAVSEILPQIALDFSQGNLYLFAISHDSRKILLHGKKNTLGIYALGGDLNLSKILIDDNEGFGKGENPPLSLVAQWKGPNRLSCLVSEKSHFLTNDPNTPARRKEIVILDTNGNLQQILSKDWPDELLDY